MSRPSRSRTHSLSVDFLSHANTDAGPNELEGLAANVKLILKLLQEHQEDAHNGVSRQPQRIASMLTIIDDIRSRVQSSKTSARIAELRRCNTDLRRSAIPAPAKDKTKPPLDPTVEEIYKLRRELLGSMTARKSLETMFSGIGKEKEMIARELAKKVHELASAEELVSDLKAQNEALSEKVRVCCNEHKGGRMIAGGGVDVLLQERNKVLSEQLLKALDGYMSTRRKLKEERMERENVQLRLFGMAEEAAAGEERVRRLRERLGRMEEDGELVADELRSLEKTFAAFCKRLSPRGSPE